MEPTVTDQTAAHPCIYCTGQFCANAGSGDKPCCPDCSGTLHHVRPDVAADIRRSAVAAEREAIAELVTHEATVERMGDSLSRSYVAPLLFDLVAAIRNRGEAQ